MDEPCSALDPITTAKVEELIDSLKKRFTIVIVTHKMQQATSCSDFTAFFYLVRLIEPIELIRYLVIQAKNKQKAPSQAGSDRERRLRRKPRRLFNCGPMMLTGLLVKRYP